MTNEGLYRCHVLGLAPSVDSKQLQDTFLPYGSISAKVVRDQRSGKSQLFGYVYFAAPGEMQEAVDLLNGSELEGKRISVYVDQLWTGSKAPKKRRSGVVVEFETAATAPSIPRRTLSQGAWSPAKDKGWGLLGNMRSLSISFSKRGSSKKEETKGAIRSRSVGNHLAAEVSPRSPSTKSSSRSRGTGSTAPDLLLHERWNH